LTLTIDNRSHKVKERYQCCDRGFIFGETMLVLIKFNVMQNMIINNEFRELREDIKNRNGSTVAYSGIIAS
jgi:hypothetical protein